MVVVAATGIAHPGAVTQDELWRGFFSSHYAGVQRALASRLFSNSGVRARHGAINPLIEDVSRWSTAKRMQRYLTEAMPLGKSAVADALDASGLRAADIGLFAVCSCTGYVTPGLTSLHVQPPTADAEQIVAHALFSDAAAAAVVLPSGPGYEVLEVTAVTDVTTADMMTWDVTDLGFRMGLSQRVPDVLDGYLAGLVDGLLSRHGLRRTDVDGWAVHPGGPRILDVVRDRLELPGEALGPSRQVLAEHGNCSSPTVLMIVDSMRAERPQHIVAMAFGPGLTLYATLLRLS